MKKRLFYWCFLFMGATLMAQKPNIAPAATISANGTGAPGCQTGACSTLNDLILGTCGSQQMWINTSSPPSSTVGDDWIQWDWSVPQAFDEMIIHHGNPSSRSLTGFLMQYWDGSGWVNGESFTSLTQQCINTVTFQKIVTSRMRITRFEMTATGQQSNPNFREIEILQASLSPNDAGITSIDSLQAVCAGTSQVQATIQNFGVNQLDSVQISWEVDGVAKSTFWYTGLLDTIGGQGSSSASITLGSHTFSTNTNYQVKAWTLLPNSATDTVNLNDTATVTLRLLAPGGLTATNITSVSADITWTATGANGYEVIYGAPGFNPGTAGTSVTTTSSPASLLGLSSATVYDAYLVADCGSGVYSDTAGPIRFSTLCSGISTITLPFYENFETATGTYVGDQVGAHCTNLAQWNFETSVQTDGRLSFDLGYSNTSIGANDTVGASMDEVANGTPINYLIGTLDMSNYDTSTTKFILLNFFHLDHGDEGQANDFVWVRGNVNDTWIQVYDLDANGVTGQWVNSGNIDLTSTLRANNQNFSSNFQVRFGQEDNTNITSASGVDGRTFDDITIEEVSCLEIPTATVSNITNSQGMVSVPLPTDSFNIEYGLCGFTQSGGTYVTGVAGSYTITGLSPNTCYDFYIQRNCDTNGVSGWVGPFSFSTECNIFTAPFIENFDGTSWIKGNSSGSGDAIDNCWRRNSEIGYKWSVYDASTSSSSTGPDQDHTGGNFLYTESSSTSPSTAEIISPKIDVSNLTVPYLSFFYHRYGSVATMGDMDVDVNDGSGWVNLLTLTGTDQTSGTDAFVQRGADISSFGDTIQVRFVGHAISCCAGDMTIDLVEVKEAPPCPVLSGLDTVLVTDTSAVLTWNSSVKANQYQVWYGPQGFFQSTQSTGGTKVTSTNDTITLSPLNAQFCYDVLLRSFCGSSDSSNWIGPISFCTKLGYDAEFVDLLVPEGCGTASADVAAVVRNNGDNAISNFSINVSLSGTITNSFSSNYTATLNTGDIDTVVMGTINTLNGAVITYDGYLNLTTDQISSNDSIRLDSVFTIPLNPNANDTTFCTNQDTAIISAFPIPGVLYNWFANSTDTVPLFTGNPYKVPLVSAQSTYYVEYSNNADSLETTLAAGNNQSGNMFDLNVLNPISLQGFTVNPVSAGAQSIEIWHKTGTYVGSEGTSAAWTQLATVSINAAAAGAPTYVALPTSVPVATGINAFYITGTSTNLNYTNGSTVGALHSSNADLEFYEGIGIAYPFGGTFSPRVWNGRIHYGSTGCSNTRVAVNLTIGSDTATAAFSVSGVGQSKTFDASASTNADHYAWDFGDGSTGTGMTTNHTYAALGTYTVTLTVSDSTDCYSTAVEDTTFLINIGLEENTLAQSLEIYPNPTSGQINISFDADNSGTVELLLTDLAGKEVMRLSSKVLNGKFEETVDLGKLADGTYTLKVSSAELEAIRRIVKQ